MLGFGVDGEIAIYTNIQNKRGEGEGEESLFLLFLLLDDGPAQS